MNFSFRRLKEKIESGQDVDIYFYLLAGVTLSMMSFLGYTPKDKEFPFLTAGITSIIISILPVRYLSDQILTRVKKIDLTERKEIETIDSFKQEAIETIDSFKQEAIETIDSFKQEAIETKDSIEEDLKKILSFEHSHNSSTEWPETLEKDLKNANLLWFYGIHLHHTIDTRYKHIKRTAQFLEQHNRQIETKENPRSIKFLLADPKASVTEMIRLRYPNGEPCGDSQMIEASIRRILGLKREYPNSIQLKTLNYLLPRAAIYIKFPIGDALPIECEPTECEPTECERIYTSEYTFGLADQKVKSVYQSGENDRFQLIRNEFLIMWQLGTSINYE